MTDSEVLRNAASQLGCEIEEAACSQLLNFLTAMLDENTRVNLTAVRDAKTAVIFHALDSLAVKLLEHDPAQTLDLGTGNGFPGIGVATLFPTAQVTLLDRTQKKVAAIDRCLKVAEFDPERVTAVADDAAQLPAHGGAEAFSLITARAVATPRQVAKLAHRLLQPTGSLLLWMAADTEVAVDLPGGLRLADQAEYSLPAPVDRHRVIALYRRR